MLAADAPPWAAFEGGGGRADGDPSALGRLLLAPLAVAVAAVLVATPAGPAAVDLAGLSQWYLLPVLFVSGIARRPGKLHGLRCVIVAAAAGLLLWRFRPRDLSTRPRRHGGKGLTCAV